MVVNGEEQRSSAFARFYPHAFSRRLSANDVELPRPNPSQAAVDDSNSNVQVPPGAAQSLRPAPVAQAPRPFVQPSSSRRLRVFNFSVERAAADAGAILDGRRPGLCLLESTLPSPMPTSDSEQPSPEWVPCHHLGEDTTGKGWIGREEDGWSASPYVDDERDRYAPALLPGIFSIPRRLLLSAALCIVEGCECLSFVTDRCG